MFALFYNFYKILDFRKIFKIHENFLASTSILGQIDKNVKIKT